MPHPLDEPVWNALTTCHASLALGGEFARRYPPDFAPIAAIRDNSARSFSELRDLVAPGSVVALASADPMPPPDGFATVLATSFDQMIATSMPDAIVPDAIVPDIVPLGAPDAVAMAALAKPLLPQSFAERAHELGSQLGVRIDGKLVAMAGERLRLTGFAEISTVCTHADYRGRGYAGALVASLGRAILDRGEIPFLHVHGENRPAIAVYRRLGFTLRRVLHMTVLRPIAA